MKKKQKINPMIKNSKKIKLQEEEPEIKTFIIILVIIIVIVGLLYGITEILKNKQEYYSRTVTKGTINYETVSAGMIFNRPYDDYYVLVYDTTSEESMKYSSLITVYLNNKDHKKIYYCDLNNSLNQKYYDVNNDQKSNKNATKVDELDFGDLTLLEIKEGKIVNYLEDYTTIQEKLK